MSLKKANLVIATGFMAIAAVTLTGTNAPASGCGNCHFRPGKCPSLPNTELFGYNPTVWQMWPGPLDPNTLYPSRDTVMPPAEPAPKTPSKPMPDAPDKLPAKPAAQLNLKPNNDNIDRTDKSSSKWVPASTYQVISDR